MSQNDQAELKPIDPELNERVCFACEVGCYVVKEQNTRYVKYQCTSCRDTIKR